MVWKHKSPAIIHAPAEALDKYGNPRIGGGLPSPRRMMMAAAGAGGGANNDFLQILTDLSLTGNLKLCLDAGDADSYTSGEKWLDTSGGGYDFMLGTETGSPSTGNEPAFTGTPGGLSIGEYFDFVNGDELFVYDTTTEGWMDNLHQDSALFSLAGVVYHAGGGDSGIISTGVPGGGTANANFYIQGYNNKIRYQVQNASVLFTGDTAYTTSAWHFFGITIDEATGAGGGFFYVDGAYDQVSASNTFDATYTTPSAAAADAPMAFGGFVTTNFAPAGYRMACLAIVEGAIWSKANMDSIFAALGPRFSL